MSMPATSITCDRCNFTTSNTVFWGIYYYQINDDSLIHIERGAGWCFDCQTFTSIEELNKEKAMAKLHRLKKELSEHQEQLSKIESYKTGFITKLFTSGSKFADLKEKVNYLQTNVNEALLYVNLINSRKSPPRCLRCCRSNITPFVIPSVEDGSGKHLSGFIHPNCGGNIIVENEGIRIAKKLRTRIYSMEGNFLKEEE